MTLPENQAPVLLSNRYRVLNLLGDGGFGKTFLVEDTHMPSGRQCVLKQLKPIEDDPEAGRIVRDRFQREAATLEKLGETHDQIPRLYAYFSQGDQFYLVTEWIEGYTLGQKVQKDGPQPESFVKKVMASLLEVIAYVHRQGIVHRDIKPDNVILRRQDGKPVLIDFGAVKETMTTQLNLGGNGLNGNGYENGQAHTIAIGTPGYMPAEQMSGRPTFASDLYSLGMTAIFLLTGRIPQELGIDDSTGEWLWRQYAPGISVGFSNFLDCAIHRDPRARFPSAESMLSILNTLIADDASRTVAGFELSSPELDPTIAPPPYRREESREIAANQADNFQRVPVESGDLYKQRDRPYETSAYEPTVVARPTAKSGAWRNAIVVGGLVGCSALFGVLLAMDKLPNLSARLGDTLGDRFGGKQDAVVEDVETAADSVDPVEETTPTPVPAPDVRRAPNANGTIAGQPGGKNVRARAGTIYAVIDSVEVGDRVQVTQKGADAEGNTWYKINTPSGQTGWIAGQLLQIDGNATLPPNSLTSDPPTSTTPATDSEDATRPDSTASSPSGSSTPADSTPPAAPADNTNAVLIGEPGSKNIRSGPGVGYDEIHEAFPGDRVVIESSDRDADGYPWYEVSFPKSGAKGWIAAQLVKKD